MLLQSKVADHGLARRTAWAHHAGFGPRPPPPPTEDVDWIIVGGGAGGCAAAAAIADSGASVALYERGPPQSDPRVNSTNYEAGWPQSVNDGGENIRWTEGVWGVAAKVLGGGTSLNGGLLFEDHEDWFAKNLPGVRRRKMKDSYEFILKNLGNPSQTTPFGSAWNEGLTEAGLGTANLSKPEYRWIEKKPFPTFSSFNMSESPARRYSAATLLEQRKSNKKLHVHTDSLVHKIVFEGKRAVGIEVSTKGSKKTTVKARKGIIVSAGAIFTPQLLQVSGVGPEEVLKKLRVPVVAHLPVGRNFVDRLVAAIGFLSSIPVNLTVGYTAYVNSDPVNQNLIEGVGGGEIASQLGVTSVAFLPPAERTWEARDALAGLFAVMGEEAPELLARVNQVISPCGLQPDTYSRGVIDAVSTDVRRPPRVTANYFKDPRDLESQKLRFNEVLKISHTKALEPYTIHKKVVSKKFDALVKRIAPELAAALSCFMRVPSNNATTRIMLPCGPYPFASDAAIEQYLRDTLVSSYHYFGTAAAGSVVDSTNFQVLGVEGLHVADASVIPATTNVNPQATIMALGHYIGTRLSADPPFSPDPLEGRLRRR